MRRLLVLLLTTGFLVGGAATAAAATPAAANPSTVDYVALGDSYAAGVGAGTGPCGRTDASYPALFAAATRPGTFTSVACSGATTAGVLSDQLGALGAGTDLVTITVGGNDTGFVPVLARCTTAPTDVACDQAVTTAERLARYVLPSALAVTYGAVRFRAPHARVLVLGYPRLFGGGDCPVPGVPDAARRARIDAGADVLDAQIAESAQRWGATFVDVRPAFAGHGLCSADPWLNPPQAPGAYHPTATGYARGYLPALLAANRT